jgi:hypothetical protein
MKSKALLLGVPVLIGVAGCISKDSGIIDTVQGCEELVPGESVDPDLEVDPDVRVMMEAASSLHSSIDGLTRDVGEACGNIATELGASDTWSSIEDPADAVVNENGTGACNAAARSMEAILRDELAAGVTFAFDVKRGPCHVDFDAIEQCDVDCAESAPCEPGSIETRCEPSNLSVQCHTTCEAGSWCEGSPANPANCMGECESTCQGQCEGACIAADGTITHDDPNCRGRCSSSCNGTCEGMCREAQAIECGSEVSCRGGCTSTYSDPVCESEVLPPDCSLNQTCHDACTARVYANPICEPTTIALYVPGGAPEDLQKVADLIEEHGALLLSAGEAKAKLANNSIDRLAESADSVSDRSGDLSGKSLACAAAASKVAFTTSAEAKALIETSILMSEVVEINSFLSSP